VHAYVPENGEQGGHVALLRSRLAAPVAQDVVSRMALRMLEAVWLGDVVSSP